MQKTLQNKADIVHPELPQNRRQTSRAATAPVLSICLGAIQFIALFAIGLLLLEGFFNLAGIGNEEFLQPDRALGVRHIPGKKVVWRLEGFSDENLSSKGLRDSEHSLAKPAGTYRVVLLGDSAVEGMQVPLKDTFGKKLEALLNASGKMPGQVEVINFGCSSYSNGQEMLLLEQQIAAYKPDLVVLVYNRGDFIENIRDPNTMNAEPRPYFHIDQNNRLSQDNTIMEFNKSAFAPHPFLDFLRNNSRIYGVLNHMNLALSLNEPLFTKTKNSIMKLIPGAKEQWKRVQAPYVILDPWQVTEGIMSRVNNDCKSLNSKFLLVCFPNNVNEKEYSRQIESLGKLATTQSFLYLNLTPDFFYHNNPKSLFLKYHLSSAGHEVAARRIAEAIQAGI